MPLLSDLGELKSLLEIDPDDTREDKKLLFFLGYATDWIAEQLNRPGLFYKSRTEFYDGTHTKYLALRSRPVYLTPTVYLDSGAEYGANEGAFASTTLLEYGTHYSLKLDQENGQISRSGLLVKIGGIWPRRAVRQGGFLTAFSDADAGSIKVTYNGGYKVEDLPSQLRLACMTLVAKMRYLFPLGMEIQSESYEERNVSFVTEQKGYLMSQVSSMIFPYRNWHF